MKGEDVNSSFRLFADFPSHVNTPFWINQNFWSHNNFLLNRQKKLIFDKHEYCPAVLYAALIPMQFFSIPATPNREKILIFHSHFPIDILIHTCAIQIYYLYICYSKVDSTICTVFSYSIIYRILKTNSLLQTTILISMVWQMLVTAHRLDGVVFAVFLALQCPIDLVELYAKKANVIYTALHSPLAVSY